MYATAVVYVPAGAKAAYEAAAHWSNFSNIVELEAGEGTGIDSVAAEDESVVHDLQGRRVDNVAKGNIYIKNGKKYILK